VAKEFTRIISPDTALNEYPASRIVILDSYILDDTDPIFRIKSQKTFSITDVDTPVYKDAVRIVQEIPTKRSKRGVKFEISGPIVSSEFQKIHQSPFKRNNKNALQIVIAAGGIDSTNFCQELCEFLAEIDLPMKVICMTRQELFSLDERFSQISPGPIFMKKLKVADLVFSTAGTTVWELLAAGIPFGYGLAFDNQRGNYETLTSRKLGVPIGVFECDSWKFDKEAITLLVASKLYRRRLRLRIAFNYKPILISNLFSSVENEINEANKSL
jgi:spore coat polysaccharide biosynthesis predicted glycosyltransferase SpsG